MSLASEAAPAPELEEEQRLVEEAQRGNLDAMRPILERYAQPLYATVILPRIGDAAAAEDVLRDAMMAAVEKIHRFTWQGKSIYPWLRQIAINKVYDVHRHTKRTRRLADALAAETPDEAIDDDNPDHILIAAQDRERQRARIEATMDAIPERYRTAIQLRLIDERSREECAQRLGITIGNFDVLLFRAVRAFRKRFGERTSE